MSTEIENIYTLSPMQQGMLFHTVYTPNSGAYFEQSSYLLEGDLDISAFEMAWQQAVESHSICRTALMWENADEPVQIVYRNVRAVIDRHDWRGMSATEQQQRADAYLKSDRERGFDLTQAPLMRLALIQLEDETYQFIWSIHHLLIDGWSRPLLLGEVVAYYDALRRGQSLQLKPRRPYADYIAWLKQQDLSGAEAFWRATLDGFTAPTPFSVDKDYSSAFDEDIYDEQRVILSADATTALQGMARRLQVTMNTVVQGAWALLMSRYSGNRDVMFGTTVSGRPPSIDGVEAMIGLFINTLPVRVLVEPEATVGAYLKRFQQEQVELREYEYSPLVQVHGWSDVPGGVPLFESLLVFENYPIDEELGKQVRQQSGSLKIGKVGDVSRAIYPLTVVAADGRQLRVRIDYQRCRFDDETIERMLGHMRALLEGFAAGCDQRISELNMLSEPERRKMIVEWNDTASSYSTELCIHELFEQQAERNPENVAVASRAEQMSYAELNRRANRLARYLIEQGVGPEVRVGICMERSVEMVVAVLGVLKAGGAYVPLDPAYPADRLAFMLRDSSSSVLLTQQSLAERLQDQSSKVVCIDSDWQMIEHHSDDNPINRATADNLAYIIYTSGSTGRPKGVELQHSGLLNLVTWHQRTYDVTSQDRASQVARFGFDASVWELWPYLASGASIHILDDAGYTTATEVMEWLIANRITVSFLPTALAEAVMDEAWPESSSLRYLLTGGDKLNRAPREGKGFALVNHYGPTENTVVATCYRVEGTTAPPPIGRPIANSQVYVVDKEMQLVGVGVSGELCIGGESLARGYLNQPELTAGGFIPNPYGERGGERLYRTGDRARYLPDGNIEYLGRIDNQVKVRGFRIELGEIEACLARHPEVKDVVVVARETASREKRLVAYFVPEGEQAPPLSELRSFLKDKLPDYMLPSACVALNSLPLTPNGKLDRRALPAPDDKRPDEEEFVRPRTLIEEIMGGIWKEVLRVKEVGVNDNFFSMGGHSLLVMQVISRMREAFRVELPLRSIFEQPTIAGQSAFVESALRAGDCQQSPPIERAPRDIELPLSFAQQRLWFLDQLESGSAFYNCLTAVRMTGPLNVTAFEQVLNELVRRHEILRTSFPEVGGRPVQVIAPVEPLILPIADLSELPENERKQESQRLAAEQAQSPFDLSSGPLMRICLLRIDGQEHVVLFTMHHIISDGWSRGVLTGEVAALYKAFSAGKPSPLTELPIQYADYAYWQQQWMQGEALDSQLAYWKKQLSDAPVLLKLPLDYPRPAVRTFEGAIHPFSLSGDAVSALKSLSQSRGATLFMTLLAAFQSLLHYCTGQEDIVVGSPIAARNRMETEGLIGFFLNNLALRTDLSGDPTFEELLERVRDITLKAYAYQDAPFQQVVEAVRPDRDLNNTPIFQVWFVLQNAPAEPSPLVDLNIDPIEAVDFVTAQYEVELLLRETAYGLDGIFKYNKSLFSASTIARMAAQFEELLTKLVDRPEARLSWLSDMLKESEREREAMKASAREEFSRMRLKKFQPKTIKLSQERLVKMEPLDRAGQMFLTAQPEIEGVNLVDWVASNTELLGTELTKHGAILFRGFNIDSVGKFEQIARSLSQSDLLDYFERSVERTKIKDKIYTASEYPAEHYIPFHNEYSYAHNWPMKLCFYCMISAQQGGETPIADGRRVFNLIDPKIREQFMRKNVMYVRNYGDGLDLAWQDVFQTSEKSVVEQYCRNAGIEWKWKGNSRLTTRQVRQSVAAHPRSGEMVWFNQAHLFHMSSLASDIRDSLMTFFKADEFPRNAFYGDGSPIEESALDEIRDAYRQTSVAFPWKTGDVLIIDNMLVAHSRAPFVGPRKIVVAMMELLDARIQEQSQKTA